MKPDLRNDLVHDAFLSAVTTRRRKRMAGLAAVVLVPVMAVAALLSPDRETPEPAVVSAAASVVEAAPSASFTMLNSEEELLNHLAHLGPVIVTKEDGSQVLYLTNDEGTGGSDAASMQ